MDTAVVPVRSNYIEALKHYQKFTPEGKLIQPVLTLKPIRMLPANRNLLNWLPRWQSNNNPADLGIIRFGFDLFPEALDKRLGVAGWVRLALYKVLAFHPLHTKIDRCHAIGTYREGSKSTWFSKILPLYLMLVGQYGIYHKMNLLPEMDYIRLRAKNTIDAEFKLNRVVSELTNENIINLFGRLEPTLKETKDKKLKNTSKYVILLNGYIFQAIGLNQPARGANIKDRRPALDIDDDVETQANTKTVRSRQYNADQVLGEQFGGLSKQGITIYIGNYVHNECMLRHLMESEAWIKQFYTMSFIDKETGEEVADWGKRFPVSYIHNLEEFYHKNPKLGGRKTFFMEYYNTIVSDYAPIIRYFKARYEHKYGRNWLVFAKNVEGQPHEQWVNSDPVVAIDPAISLKTESSDGVVLTNFFCSDKKIRPFDLSLGKHDLHDRYKAGTIPAPILAQTPEDLKKLDRRGGVDEVVRQTLRYHSTKIVIETAGQQLAWFNEIEALLKKLGMRTTNTTSESSVQLFPYRPTDEKDYKIQTGLLPYFSEGFYEINEILPFKQTLITQLTQFPDAKKDVLDTLFNSHQIGTFPEPIEIDRALQTPLHKQRQDSAYETLFNNQDIDPLMIL